MAAMLIFRTIRLRINPKELFGTRSVKTGSKTSFFAKMG